MGSSASVDVLAMLPIRPCVHGSRTAGCRRGRPRPPHRWSVRLRLGHLASPGVTLRPGSRPAKPPLLRWLSTLRPESAPADPAPGRRAAQLSRRAVLPTRAISVGHASARRASLAAVAMSPPGSAPGFWPFHQVRGARAGSGRQRQRRRLDALLTTGAHRLRWAIPDMQKIPGLPARGSPSAAWRMLSRPEGPSGILPGASPPRGSTGSRLASPPCGPVSPWSRPGGTRSRWSCGAPVPPRRGPDFRCGHLRGVSYGCRPFARI